jgi:hypothetical protein
LEAEEGKVLKVQLELTQVRQDFDRKLSDRDEEIDNLRKNQQRQLDALQGSLDGEVKAKNEQVIFYPLLIATCFRFVCLSVLFKMAFRKTLHDKENPHIFFAGSSQEEVRKRCHRA